jgi:hypothetical protein
VKKKEGRNERISRSLERISLHTKTNSSMVPTVVFCTISWPTDLEKLDISQDRISM